MSGSTWPEGQITVLFTDIVGSTRMARSVGDDVYREALREPHNQLIRKAAADTGGWEVGTPAGDSFMLVFARARDAARCAWRIQEGLASEPPRAVDPQGQEWRVRVRIGIHTSESPLRRTAEGEYVGSDVSLANRVESLGTGGQVLLSSSAWRACRDEADLSWVRWPNRRLRGFEGLETLYELLWSGASLGEPGASGRPVHEQARQHFETGRWTEAWGCLVEARDLAIQHGDRRGQVLTEANLGAVGINLHRLDEADRYLEAALEGARQLGDRVLEARLLGNQAVSAWKQGRPQAAERAWRKAIRLAEEFRDWPEVVRLLRVVARLRREVGEEARAARDLASARQLAARQGLVREEARTLQAMALLAFEQGQPEAAGQRLGEALEIAVPQADRGLEAQVLNNLGVVAHLGGELAKAERYYRTSAEILQEVRNPLDSARVLLNLGALMYQWGEHDTARHLLTHSRDTLSGRSDFLGEGAALANLALVARAGDQGERDAGEAMARTAAEGLEAGGDAAGAARVREWLASWGTGPI